MSQPNSIDSISWQTRIKEWFFGIPLATRLIFLMCVSVFVASFVSPSLVHSFCLRPGTLGSAKFWQICAIFTAPFIHFSILHIVFNMGTLLSLGPWLERRIGSASFLLVGVFGAPVLVGSAHLLMAVIVSQIPMLTSSQFGKVLGNPSHSCSAGYSGVLFALVSAKVFLPGSSKFRTLFGMKIPARAYPFALLLVLQFMWPNVSFYGHLAGIVVGWAYAKGFLDALQPSARVCTLIDSWVPAGFSSWLTHSSLGSLPTTSSSQSPQQTAAPSSKFKLQQVAPPPNFNLKTTTTSTPAFYGQGHRLGDK